METPILHGGEVFLEVQTENFTAPATPKASKKKKQWFLYPDARQMDSESILSCIWLNIDGIHVYLGTQMTSIFEGQPPQNKAFSNQNKGHLGSREVNFLYMEGGDNSAYW